MNKHIKISPILFFLLLTIIHVSDRCKAKSVTHVIITNKLEGRMSLQMHCKSKNDDLGIHILSYQSQYGFKFKPNILYTTLYFCSFIWNDQLHWFDIFVYNRDQYCVGEESCPWVVKQSGPCYLGIYNVTKCYDWNKSPL